MLPGLPRNPEDHHITLVTEPRREVVEVTVDDQLVLHIIEPVAVPSTTGGGGGLVAFSDTGVLLGIAGKAGIDGPWTLTPEPWRVTIAAAVGDILEWAPTVALGGGPAALDLVSVVNGAIARSLSSNSATPAGYGSLYTQGDYGTARLPVQRWRVTTADRAGDGTVTLALAYRDGTGDVSTLGHEAMITRLTLVNLGKPGGTSGGGSGGGTPGGALSDPITWDDLGTPGAPPPTDVRDGTVPAANTAGSRFFTGDGHPNEQPFDGPLATAALDDVFLDRLNGKLYQFGTEGWYMIADLSLDDTDVVDTVFYLGVGNPNETPGAFHRVRRLAIDMATFEFYEIGMDLEGLGE